MASTCKVYENNEDLGSEALVPVINLHKMRKYNQREEINEQVALLKAEDVERHFQRGKEDSRLYGVRVNASCTAHMTLHKRTASAIDRKPYEITREDKLVTISVQNKEWEQEEDVPKEKKKIAELIGKLSEKAILDNVLDNGKVHVLHALPYEEEGFVHYCNRETDGFHRFGKKLVAVEVKSLGKLTSYKARLFNNRLFSLVAKSIATRSSVTFVVIRDDARMNLEKGELGIVEVQLWEDVKRLLLPTDYKNLKATHRENLKIMADKNVFGLESHKNYVQFKGKNSQTVRTNTCEAKVPNAKKKQFTKSSNKHVVVGPNIPYFDFILKDVFLTYRHKYEKRWKIKEKQQVYVIANSWDDVREMFKSYIRPSNLVNITFYVKEPLNQKYSSVCSHFKQEDKLKHVEFQSYAQVGTKLFTQKLTHWEFPIPQVLLLLGEGEHVPKLLITARLSFGILAKAGNTYTTGISLEDVPYPDMIAVLGTAEECKAGVELAAKTFADRLVVGFASNGVKCLVDGRKEIQRSRGKYTDLDRELSSLGFPMYKEFYHAEEEWKAT